MCEVYGKSLLEYVLEYLRLVLDKSSEDGYMCSKKVPSEENVATAISALANENV